MGKDHMYSHLYGGYLTTIFRGMARGRSHYIQRTSLHSLIPSTLSLSTTIDVIAHASKLDLLTFTISKTVFYKKWFQKNIVYVSDLLDDKGFFISLEELQKNYKIKTNFLTYASLQSSIK
jgi:hypothetical protein